MGKIYSIFSEDWMKAGAKVDVDRFLKKKGMNPNLNLDILDFADYIGLQTYYYDFENYSVAGSIHSDKNMILINSIYADNYVMEARIVSYLLGMYFFANDRITKNTLKEEDLKKLREMGVDIQKSKSKAEAVVNHTIYKSDLEEVKEGDPELYFFTKELMSRDFTVQTVDRSF
jgi:hypothetical protein